MLIWNHTAQAVTSGYKGIGSSVRFLKEGERKARELGYRDGRLYEVLPDPEREAEFWLRTYKFLSIDDPYDPPAIVVVPEMNDSTVNARVERWHNAQTSLVQCVREFRWANSYLAEPRYAAGICGTTSERFLSFLQRRGVVSYEMRRTEEAHVDSWESGGHWYSRVRTIVIDWTYRQFDATCPFPYIWSTRKKAA
ncbi:MAG: hypothetical protein V4465_03075 [Patescibacteria group bacterium]